MVVIMIKSSDPLFANTYRIIRVLSSQDYLATDHLASRYVFSEVKTPLEPPLPLPASARPQVALLRHREVIALDGMQYAVFAVGTGEVAWAGLVSGKRLEQEGFVERLVIRCCQGLLKELIWMGSSQARKYLDLRNLWLVGEELRLLLVPRCRLPIKKCEQRSVSGDKSIDQLMQAEQSLLKDFALLLWQVCFQRSYYEDDCVTAHGRTRQTLRRMVSRAITYEELVQELSKQPVVSVYTRRVKFKPFLQRDLLPNRKTISFMQRPSKASLHSGNASRVAQAATETLKRPNQTGLRELRQSTAGKAFRISEGVRSSSVENASTLNNSFRRSRYVHSKQAHSSSKEMVHYDRWLQSRRFSIQTREKLIRNGEMARKKYSQAFELSRREGTGGKGKQQRLDDSAFKEKILSKVIKFKNAMKQKKSHSPAIHEETISSRPESPLLNQESTQIRENHSIPMKEMAFRHEQQERLASKAQQSDTETIRHLPAPKKQQGQAVQERKVENEFAYSPPQKQVSLSTLKTEKKKLSRIDALTANPADEDLEVVKLQQQQPRVIIPPPKKQSNPPPPIASKPSSKVMGAGEALNEMLMLVNTLGDMTVRAVKGKDRLTAINWRQATYFLYERFHFERGRIADCLARGQPVCRRHRTVDQRQWQKFLQGSEKQEAVTQMGAENGQITATLGKLGQKMLQEETLERKIEYFVKNREKIATKSDSKLRAQLSRYLVAALVSEFDFACEQRLESEEVVRFLSDCCFGLYVVGELDGVVPPDQFVRLKDYKQYDKTTLNGLKPAFDFIDAAYFPKDSSWEAL